MLSFGIWIWNERITLSIKPAFVKSLTSTSWKMSVTEMMELSKMKFILSSEAIDWHYSFSQVTHIL